MVETSTLPTSVGPSSGGCKPSRLPARSIMTQPQPVPPADQLTRFAAHLPQAFAASQAAFDRIQEIIGRISKRSQAKVKLYSEHQSIFDRFNITKQLETTFSRQVMLKGGGYIVIDETEALVAIDVNTGRHKGSKDQDTTILKVNLEAAEEIARQLRLRNMGGLIVLLAAATYLRFYNVSWLEIGRAHV